MSATYCWRAVKPPEGTLDTNLSGLQGALTDRFGTETRWTIESGDRDFIVGLVAAEPGWRDLLDVLDKHGTIEVWVEW